MSNLLKFFQISFILSLIKLVINFILNRNTKYPNYLIKFENKLAKYFNYKYCLSFANGTSAADSIFNSLNLKEKNVIISKLTFPSIICSLLRNGANLYYLDFDYNFDLLIEGEEQKIKNSEFILLTSVYGFSQKKKIIEKIREINPEIKIVEDMSHSQCSPKLINKHKKHNLASFMSMQGSKAISAGEGGVAFTDSEKIYKEMIIYSHINRKNETLIGDLENLSKIGFGNKSRMHPFGVFSAEFDLNRLELRNKILREKFNQIYATLEKSRKIIIPKISDYNELGGFHYGLPFFINKKISLDPDFKNKHNILRYNWPALDKLDFFHSSINFKKIEILNNDFAKVFLKTEDLRDQLYFIDLNFILINKKKLINKKISEFISEI